MSEVWEEAVQKTMEKKRLMFAEINKESFLLIPRVAYDIMRYRMFGIPEIHLPNNEVIARFIIKRNSKNIFKAGQYLELVI
jgi:hypothetical protein